MIMVWKPMLATAVAFAARAVPEVLVAPEAKGFVAGAADDMTLRPSPIEPSWIISGTPVARLAEHSRGQDDAAVTAIWDCTSGAFNWHFGWDETVMILEGEVLVTTEDGTERLLRAGDVAYFPGGSSAVWSIETYVKKIAFCRKPFPRPLTVAYRLRNFIRSGGVQGLAA
jgi:uncharacterized cupin superfamily protein